MNKYNYKDYEIIIGLEIHAQLLTQSKVFSSDPNKYGSSPNTNVSVVSLGHPGTLPVLNKKVIEYAVKLGIACNCNITYRNEFARKNYFYADLPKGYQITQSKTPICTNGFIYINDDNGNEKKIGITRIHIEEDSGKSIHDQDPFNTLIDLNRAGVPLLEIVSSTDIRSPQEAYNYIAEIRKILRYLKICDGNMEEGNLRCDANVSVRKRGSTKFGEKVEIKNMNSLRNVKRALEYEFKRQIKELEKGKEIYQETRSFDPVKGKTFVMRTKEMAHDYRYFTEPDLLPVFITNDFINKIKKEMPALPRELYQKFLKKYKLSKYDASIISENREIAEYFEEIVKYTNNYKAAANWLIVNIKGYLNEKAIDINSFNVKAKFIAELINLIDKGKINNTIATQKIFPEMIKNPEKSPELIVDEKHIVQESNEKTIKELVIKAINKYPEKVTEYKKGKKGLIGLFMGEIMRISKGKADPKKANEILRSILDNQ